MHVNIWYLIFAYCISTVCASLLLPFELDKLSRKNGENFNRCKVLHSHDILSLVPIANTVYSLLTFIEILHKFYTPSKEKNEQ